MDQALDPLLEHDEGAVVDDADHLALDALADRILLGDQDPRVLEALLVAERDALALAIEAQDDHVDLVADLEVLRGMADPAPRDVGDVQQAVEPAEVDEHSVVGDVLDHAADQLALFEDRHGLFLDLALLLFEDGLARQHDVGAAAVEGDDPRLDLLSEVVFEAPVRQQVDQRPGEKRAHADVNRQAALDPLENGAADRARVLEGLLDRAPGLELGGAVAGQPDPSLDLVEALDKDLDLIVDLDLDLVCLGVRKLGHRNAALALEADVDKHLFGGHGNDRAVHDLSLAQGLQRGLHELFHGELVHPPFIFLIAIHIPVRIQDSSSSLDAPHCEPSLRNLMTLGVLMWTVKRPPTNADAPRTPAARQPRRDSIRSCPRPTTRGRPGAATRSVTCPAGRAAAAACGPRPG